jgi:FKBP-type peptidyl-prolyl cis-trans isomerase FkpA
MNKLYIFIGAVLLALALVTTASAESFTTLPSGLEYKDLKVGIGSEAQLGDIAHIHFTGWVDENGQRGKEIYNSRKGGEPVAFVIGTDKVMQGWNEGVLGMRAGGTRLLRIPPELGYGDKAVEDVVPANAYLQFIIELLEITK